MTEVTSIHAPIDEVEVHNYIDDLGNQLADTVVGILNTTTEQPYERFGSLSDS